MTTGSPDFKSFSDRKAIPKPAEGRPRDMAVGSLPWHEELLSISRDKGKLLAHTQHQNLHLRSQLKQLSYQLDQAIAATQARKIVKPPHSPTNTSQEELKSARNQLQTVEKEYNRVKNRFNLLADKEYTLKLEENIEKQTKTMKLLEFMRVKRERRQLKREKELEIGENSSISQDIDNLAVLRKKISSIETANQQNAVAFEKITAKNEELMQEIAKLTAEIGEIPEKEDNSVTTLYENTHKMMINAEIKQKSVISKLKSQLNQLKLELSSALEEENRLKEQINAKIVKIEENNEEIKVLKPLSKQVSQENLTGNRSKSVGKRQKDTFLTQI